VLAVGDAAFQKKCLGKMGEVAKGGRTVLFVSHNMGAVQSLCKHGAVLSSGRVCFTGSAAEAVSVYLRESEPTRNRRVAEVTNRSGTGDVRLLDFWVEDAAGRPVDVVASGQELVLVFRYRVAAGRTANNASFGFSVHTLLGDTLCVHYSDYAGVLFSGLHGEGVIRYRIAEFPLNQGRYPVGARVVVNGVEADWVREPVGTLDVVAGDYRGINATQHSGSGPVLIPGDWRVAEGALSSR
jgi:lipopolysaccharide transport system ATP-binding protein